MKKKPKKSSKLSHEEQQKHEIAKEFVAQRLAELIWRRVQLDQEQQKKSKL